MFNHIPKTRLLLYFILGGLFPIFVALFYFFSQEGEIEQVHNSLEEVQQMAMMHERKQAVNMAVRNHFRDADHFYIDKHLETLIFLEPEIESLQKILNTKSFVDDEHVKKRLELLTGPGNSMVFAEGTVESTPFFQETTETLLHPVEVNGSDLQKILSEIEGIDIGEYTPSPNRPQLIVLDLRMDRKNITEKNEVFVLNLKLLKREYL